MRLWMGLGSLLFGGVAAAHPTMGLPEVSAGANPYRSFASDGTVRTITTPDDQDFIITLINPEASIRIDGVSISHSALATSEGKRDAALYTGHGKLRVPSGSELRLAGEKYYVQGYFIQAGSPYRFASGEVAASGELVTVFTAEPERDFIASTVAIRDYHTHTCDLYLNESVHVRADTYLMSPGNVSPNVAVGGLVRGKGSIVVPAGLSLQILNLGSVPCFFYIDGEYIRP